jgi:3-deoxy-manno-octulosonate cytidylyltransferase (CMP-KDO synthetase)
VTGGDGRAARTVAVIPSRYGSTRLKAKALLAETGRPLVVHVLERARAAKRIGRVIVATDDARIVEAVRRAGGEAALTRADHPTGSDRIGELLPQLEADVVVNVQGDEPEVEPELLDALVERLESDPSIEVATAATPFTDRASFRDPNWVKVVCDRSGRALYFSRSPIPGGKSDGPDPWSVGGAPLLHIGVYAYRRSALETFLRLPPSPLETAESLEQLRLVEHGARFGVVVTSRAARGIDTPEDYAAFVSRNRKGPVKLG